MEDAKVRRRVGETASAYGVVSGGFAVQHRARRRQRVAAEYSWGHVPYRMVCTRPEACEEGCGRGKVVRREQTGVSTDQERPSANGGAGRDLRSSILPTSRGVADMRQTPRDPAAARWRSQKHDEEMDHGGFRPSRPTAEAVPGESRPSAAHCAWTLAPFSPCYGTGRGSSTEH